MKQNKFRFFSVTFSDGVTLNIKTPSLVTESYCKKLAYHVANKQYGTNYGLLDAVSVVGLTSYQ